MLQTHRGSAAAAPAPAPAPGEMLMGFCRIWRVIGRREFGATSSSPCHWLGAICCSLGRELLAPPPLSFSCSAPLSPAAGPLPESRGLGGAGKPSLRSRERTGAGGRMVGVGTRPGPAPRTRRPDGPRGSLPGNSGEAPGPTTARGSLPPSRSQGRLGGQTWLQSWGREPRRPTGSRLTGGMRDSSPRGAGPGAVAEQWPRSAHQPRRANPRPPRARARACPCVCVRARACVRVCGTARAHGVLPLGAPSRGQSPPGTARRGGGGIPSLCPGGWDVCGMFGGSSGCQVVIGDRLQGKRQEAQARAFTQTQARGLTGTCRTSN
ncbi:translation initiation factor IF-2-like [Phoca vitulina]|uniref:translation initiation factor IF-2-like n=1 Tax=Phoca vitulina TaxID=9720 RepID=UPI00139605B2|nr:translation initiation factor IF-2-like [Phoca vitulina]